MNRRPKIVFHKAYAAFDIPVVAFDCSEKCAPHIPNEKPFYCDICHAVPAVNIEEWECQKLDRFMAAAATGCVCI